MTPVSVLKKVLSLPILWSTAGFAKGDHLTRHFMYRHISAILSSLKLDPGRKRILSISHSTRLCQLIGVDELEITEANYPQVNMLDLPFDDNLFDYVVSDQVLEHIEGDPRKAIEESRRVLRPEGIVIHTTCFMNEIHGAPNDLWRFTPAGLRNLCSGFSQILDSGGWGNACALFLIWLGLRYSLIPCVSWHPLNRIATIQNLNLPIVTWIIARK